MHSDFVPQGRPGGAVERVRTSHLQRADRRSKRTIEQQFNVPMTESAVQASPEFEVHLGTDDLLKFLGHRLDHRPFTNVGQGSLGVTPRHGFALSAPVGSCPTAYGCHLGPIVTLLPIHLDRQLPADRWLQTDA